LSHLLIGRHFRISGLSALFALVAILCLSGNTLAWDAGTFSPGDEQALFALTNTDRAAAGLPALVEDTYLHKEAQWRVQDMATRDYFAHEIPPDGKMVFAYMSADGYCYQVAGENIGESNYGDDATTQIEIAFMKSPEHRDNILGAWTRLGVGAYRSASGLKLWAVLFSLPCGAAKPVPVPTPPSAPKATPAPTPVPTAKATPQPTPVPTAKATPRPTPVSPAKPRPTPTLTPIPTVDPTAVPTPIASPDPCPRAACAPAPSSDPGPAVTPPPSSREPASILTQLNGLRAYLSGPVQSLCDFFFRLLFGRLAGG